MCNCYEQKCEECDEEMPIHIGDFRYDPSELKVYCSQHLPSSRVTVFTVIGHEFEDDDDWDEKPIGWKCGFRLKDGDIEPGSEDVFPNLGSQLHIEIHT